MSRALKKYSAIISEERPRIWRYSTAAGPTRSKFLLTLRDQQKIMGTKCSSCGRAYVPARSTCLKCFKNMDEWVEVSDQGTVETFTVVHQSEPVYAEEIPFAFGVIKLDGADTGLVHRIGGIDLETISVGMRVKAVFEDERKGDIRDIKHFQPV